MIQQQIWVDVNKFFSTHREIGMGCLGTEETSQKTRVWFPAPIFRGFQLPVTTVPGFQPPSLAASGTCLHTVHTQTSRHTRTNKKQKEGAIPKVHYKARKMFLLEGVHWELFRCLELSLSFLTTGEGEPSACSGVHSESIRPSTMSTQWPQEE